MRIQINTDHNIPGREALVERLSKDVASALANVSKRVTRVEIHLSDENSERGAQGDKRCAMEARLNGRQPIAVTEHASSLDLAAQGACRKLTKMISGIVDAQRDSKPHSDGTHPDGLAQSED